MTIEKTDVPEGWQIKTIKELGGAPGTVQTGPFGAQLHAEDYAEEGVPLLLIRNLRDGRLLLKDMPRVREEDALRLSRYRLAPGDVVFSRVGRVGSCFLAEPCHAGWLISGQLLRVRLPDEVISKSYLYRALTSNSVQDRISGESVGTTRTSINTRILESLSILVPTPEEQGEIATILSTIDKAIEQTEAIIAKQTRIKTGLMNDLLTRGIDEHGNIRSEATHQFKDSPLGRIPAEWDIRPLLQVAMVERGKFTHRPRNDPRYYGGEIPFIQTGDITAADGRVLLTYSQTLNKDGARVSKEFPVGTIAITIAANIGDTAILGIPMYFPDSVVGAVVSPPHNVRYVELCMRYRKGLLASQAPQSAQKNINLETLRPLVIPVAHPREQERIAGIYDALDAKLSSEEHNLRKLKAIKCGLMRDLLTGKVRVTELLNKNKELAAGMA